MGEHRAVDLDAVFDLATPSDPRWSPDGSRLTCTVTRPDLDANRERSRIWLVDAVTSTPPRPLTGGQHVDRMARWSPDGKLIAFVSDRSGCDEVWLIRPDGGEAWRLVGATAGAGPLAIDDFFAALEWRPDGAELAFVAQEPAPPPDAGPFATDARVVGRDDGEGYGDVRRFQVWAIPAEGGAARALTDDDYHSGDFRWSPDGRAVAFVSNRSGDEEAVRFSVDKDFDLWLLGLATGETRQLTTNPGPDHGPRWSPDGRSIAYISTPRRGSHKDVFQLTAISVVGGEARKLTDLEGPHVDRLGDACWSPDSSTVYCTAAHRARNVLLAAPADGSAPARVVASGPYLCESLSLSPDGARIACAVHGPERPPELCLVPEAGGEPEPLTAFNASWRDRALARTEERRWLSPDGLEVEGLVALPRGRRAGDPVPLLVVPHGGPHSRSALGFGVEWQYWTARGFAIFAPNFRGSLGYGQAFVDADRRDFGGGDFADVMSGVDLLIRERIADPERLAIMGGSYGGFLTAWAIGHTDRFRAAVAVEPVVNLQSFYGQTDIKSWVEWEFGYPWAVPELVAAHSPINHVARARTPTLTIQGDADRRVPPPQAQELYTALRKLGVPTQLVYYPREGHGIKEPRHRRDLLVRVGEWLERYLA